MNHEGVRKAVEDGNRKFCAAAEKKDFAGMAALYTENGMVLAPDTPVVTGRKAIEDFWSAAAHALGLTSVSLETMDLDVSGDSACETGEADLTTSSGPVKVKYLVLWRRDGDGQWRLHRDMWNNTPD